MKKKKKKKKTPFDLEAALEGGGDTPESTDAPAAEDTPQSTESKDTEKKTDGKMKHLIILRGIQSIVYSGETLGEQINLPTS